jgi:hypothetical protein
MQWFSSLIAAMSLVESQGNPAAIGDRGQAFGCLQIQPGVLHDVNRVFRTQYTHEDAKDPQRAARICELYLMYYAGPSATPEKCARIWNGGPRGHREPATLPYWHKVQSALAAGLPAPRIRAAAQAAAH